MPLALRLLLIVTATTLLPGCKPTPDAPVAAAAPPASASAGAADDSPAALMAQAFPGWAATRPHAASMPSGEGAAQEPVLVSPLKVVPLDAEHRMLLVTGVPDDGTGQPLQLHATSVNVGAYGFERREGRWVKTFERPSLVWTGFNGQVGEVKVHDLGAGRTALSLQNGTCGQDVCSEWVRFFALAPGDARALTPDLPLSRKLEDAPGCAPWLAGQPASAPDPADAFTPENCVDVSGTWRFEPAADPATAGWPDLVVAFKGSKAVQDGSTGQAAPRAVDEKLVLRHDGRGYQVVSGRNPLD